MPSIWLSSVTGYMTPQINHFFLSKELRAILGLTLAQALPTPSELIQLIHEDCRDDIVKLLNSFSDEISEVGRELSLLHRYVPTTGIPLFATSIPILELD